MQPIRCCGHEMGLYVRTILRYGWYVCLQSCCLCYVRGGALKRTTDARWAHILCALLLPGVAFKDSVCKEPISVLSVNKVNTAVVSIRT